MTVLCVFQAPNLLIASACKLLQGKLQQLEEALLASSVGGLAADGDESGACCQLLRGVRLF